jgi:hypothetical protein
MHARSRRSPRGALRERAWLGVCALATVGLAFGACGASAKGGDEARAAKGAPPRSSGPCGTGAPQVAAAAAGVVARRIYDLELNSAEVRSDRSQIETFQPLLSALATGNRAAVAEAVTSLVFSHTHVVRLRVSTSAGVLADVGGPYILAPIAGSLRSGGRSIGRFVFSVQDDSGYQKLEDRFIGAPVLMRIGGRRLPVEGTLPAAAASLPFSGHVAYHGASYQVLTLRVRAFPAGTLSISLLLTVPASSTLPCPLVAVGELDRIGERVWDRFTTVGAPASAYVLSLGGLTGARAYVREGGRQLAGSGPGPRHLPLNGSVRYRRVDYHVSSFAAVASGRPVRVYQLLVP